MYATITRTDALDLARLADDGCPNVADVNDVPERQHVAFVEMLQHARSIAQRRSFTRVPHPRDSGPIRVW